MSQQPMPSYPEANTLPAELSGRPTVPYRDIQKINSKQRPTEISGRSTAPYQDFRKINSPTTEISGRSSVPHPEDQQQKRPAIPKY